MFCCHADVTELRDNSLNTRGGLFILFRFTTLESDVNCSKKTSRSQSFHNTVGAAQCVVFS